MKNLFAKPSLRIVKLDECDLIVTSPQTDGNDFTDPDKGLDARSRHNPIWDDYE